jgi:hypothetical protein
MKPVHAANSFSLSERVLVFLLGFVEDRGDGRGLRYDDAMPLRIESSGVTGTKSESKDWRQGLAMMRRCRNGATVMRVPSQRELATSKHRNECSDHADRRNQDA